MSTTVLLVDDHELIRNGLRLAFERHPDFEIAGEAGTVAEALTAVKELSPDVLILDVRLPDGNGLETVRRLRAAGETMGIVILTMYPGDDQLLGALEAGASGFVAKNAPVGEVLAAASHAAATPQAFTASELADAMRRRLTPPSGPQLSPRERQVLQLLADGKAVAGIAAELYISASTAKTHVAKLYEKLGASNRAQALMIALRAGLLSPERPA